MQLALKVFIAIFLVSLFLGSLLMVAVNFKNASDVASLENNLIGQMALALGRGDLASPGEWRLAGVLWLLLAGSSIVGIVAAFLKRHKFGLGVGIGLAVLTVAVVAMQPSITSGSGNDPRVTGMGIAVFGMLGVGLLILVHTGLREGKG